MFDTEYCICNQKISLLTSTQNKKTIINALTYLSVSLLAVTKDFGIRILGEYLSEVGVAAIRIETINELVFIAV